MVRAFIVSSLLMLCSGRAQQVLYNLSFSEPIHQVGQPASLGGPNPQLFTSRVFGSSVILNQVAGHAGVLQFLPAPASPGNALQYSQFSLFTPNLSRYVRTGFDLFVANMALPANPTQYSGGPDDAFTLLFDTQATTRLDFIGGGRVLQNEQDIGGYVTGQWLAITVDIDLAQNLWSIYQNGVRMTTTPFFQPPPAAAGYPPTFFSIRLNVADNLPNPLTPVVYLDNFKFSTGPSAFVAIPEPATIASVLGGAGLLLVLLRRWRISA